MFAEEGILVKIEKSKTDRAGVGALKLLPRMMSMRCASEIPLHI